MPRRHHSKSVVNVFKRHQKEEDDDDDHDDVDSQYHLRYSEIGRMGVQFVAFANDTDFGLALQPWDRTAAFARRLAERKMYEFRRMPLVTKSAEQPSAILLSWRRPRTIILKNPDDYIFPWHIDHQMCFYEAYTLEPAFSGMLYAYDILGDGSSGSLWLKRVVQV